MNQELSQNQSQKQQLNFNQTLKRSLQILQYNNLMLNQYLSEQSMENPFLIIESTEIDLPERRLASLADEMDGHEIADNHATISLYTYLLDQIYLSMRDTHLRDLVLYLVSQLDEDGYLRINLQANGRQQGATDVEMLDALTLLQQLDPPGVGARNLQEALLLQIDQDDDAPKAAYAVVADHFEAFATHHWQEIESIDETQLQRILDYVQSLNPIPGAQFNGKQTVYIRPDLKVSTKDGELIVQLTRSTVPKVAFQANYFKKMQHESDPALSHYLKQKKANFEQLQYSIQQRGNTILAVGNYIVAHQKSFFTSSEHPLSPMRLKDVALFLHLSISTISRAVNDKFVQTEFGVYELKYFFTQGIATSLQVDQAVSNQQVKGQLAQLIENEDKHHPLSDQILADQLGKMGFVLSRRTVTKYRQALKIPATTKRKRFD